MTKVVSVKRREPGYPVEVYDLSFRNAGRYYAAGVLVSNSKRLGMLNVHALLSHGATAVLGEAGAVRGARNEDYWSQVLQGHTPPTPDVPPVYRRFVAELQAAGAQVARDKHKLHLYGMTADDARKLSGDRLLTSPTTVRAGSLEPVPGGLFDPALTGGLGGKQWSAIQLEEPMPSPLFEEPLRRLLGLTRNQYEGVIAGTEELPGHGTGTAAIQSAFKGFDVDKAAASARLGLKATTATAREESRRKLGYLQGMQKYGLAPQDFLFDRVPVLPPAFRTVTQLPSGSPVIADANYLYQDLMRANANLKGLKETLGDQHVGNERLAVYKAYKAVVGLGDPIGRKSIDRDVGGILKKVFGGSPKFSSVQRKLLSTTVDNVGRGVIIPDPELDMDEIGLPVDVAYDSYSRHVVARLVRSGLTPVEAARAVRDRTPVAAKALSSEMAERPVYADRAPVLHKFGVLGFKPVLTAGRVLRLPPVVFKGLGADSDGDTMQVHVPATDKAVDEVFQMLPSRHLLSPADFETPVHTPGQQFQAGLHYATANKSDKRARSFADAAAVVRALKAGEIDASDPVEFHHA